MARNPLAEAIAENARQLETLKGAHVEEFLRMLRALQDTVRGRLAGLYPSGKDFDTYQLLRVDRETQAMIEVLEEKASKSYGKKQDQTAKLASGHLIKELDRLSRAFDGKGFSVNLDAAKLISDPERKILAETYRTSVQRWGLGVLNGVRRDLFQMVRGGLKYGDVVSRVAGANAQGFGNVARADAERLVRTETSSLYAAAKSRSIDQAAEKSPELATTWHHTSSYECDYCNELHGTKRPESGFWTVTMGIKVKRTVKVKAPPLHPNCLPPGTRVQTSTGSDPIEKIALGQYVLGGLTGQPRRVTRVHVNYFDGRLVIVSGDDFEIALTGNHPVLTDEGWTAAESIDVGDHVFKHGRKDRALFAHGYPLHVRKVLHMPYRGKVYNLTVDTDESYVASGVVVHNCTCTTVALKPSWEKGLKKLGYL